MKIMERKAALHDARILAVLSHSLYEPSPEKLRTLAQTCASDHAVSVYACEDHGRILGVVIVKRTDHSTAEILRIATDPCHRRAGVASSLIFHAAAALQCAALTAETDDDTVGFYRKCGFQVETLATIYPGTNRYRCTWKPEKCKPSTP